MNINQYRQHKYLSLNTYQSSTDNYSYLWDVPNLNLSNKSQISLIRCNSTSSNDSNLYLSFCRNMGYNNYYSSIANYPLIYSGVGLNNQNIPRKLNYTINGANLNDIQIYNYVSTPQNDFSYPELDGLKPNLWCKFDTGTLTTNDGTDAITLTNNGTATNAGISVRGNNSISFNGTNQDITGSLNINNGSFSISLWTYIKAIGTGFHFFTFGNSVSYNGLFYLAFRTTTRYEIGVYGTYGNTTTEVFANEINNWVHIVITFNINTSTFYIYRNGVKLTNQYSILPVAMALNSNFQIASMVSAANWYNGYIDDFRVYKNTVLSQDQIDELYNGRRLNYPIIKNESYLPANSTTNDPNIHTIPNLWCKFDTGALTVNSGTDSIIINNSSIGNSGVSVRGNNSASFTGAGGTYMNGPINNISLNSWSISVWLYSTNATNGEVVSFGNGLSAFTGLVMGYGTGSVGCYYITDFNLQANSINFSSDVNNWVHIVYIFNSTTLERSIYRNGIKLVLTNSITSGLSTVTPNFGIGIKSGGYYYRGYMDDLRIYTGKVLEQEEITRIYTGARTDYTTPITEPLIGQDLNPIIWYKFDDANNIGLDSMGKANGVQEGSFAIPTYDSTSYIRGNGSISLTQSKTLKATYNFSDIINEITICFWIRITGYGTNNAYDIILSGAQPRFYIARNAGTSNIDISIFGSVYQYNTHFNGLYTNDKIWRHFTIIAQKTLSGSVKITSYVNGVFNATATSGTWDTSGIVYYNISFSSLSMIGNLDDMRFYNRVLSQAQISEIYQNNTFYKLPTINTKYQLMPLVESPVLNAGGGVVSGVQIPNTPYFYYTIPSTANLTIKKDIICDILIIAGGGSGGCRTGGGGGAGALIYLKNETLKAGDYIFTIGTGGASQTLPSNGNYGNNTVITKSGIEIYKARGGGGGGNPNVGNTGGSSGGTCGGNTNISPAPLNDNIPSGVYGNYGGRGSIGGIENQFAGGGGGGAASNGFDAENTTIAKSGNGGLGKLIDITGTPTYYAGGGGGGGGAGTIISVGGIGGGGAGSVGFTNATAGSANTGGGGGGSGFTGASSNGASGAGGSGVVIFRTSLIDSITYNFEIKD